MAFVFFCLRNLRNLRFPLPRLSSDAARTVYNVAMRRWWLLGIILGLLIALSACGETPLSLAWEAPPADTPFPLGVPTFTPVGGQTPTPAPSSPPATPTPTPTAEATRAPYIYYTQAGDTLPALAVRFGVAVNEIRSNHPLPAKGLLSPHTMLIIPRRLGETSSPVHLLPDSEIVYSPSAIGFDAVAYAQQANGALAHYHEYLKSTGRIDGAHLLAEVALNNSINPRLLLALLDYQGHWVRSSPTNERETTYPLGKVDLRYKRLYRQLAWAVNQLSIGYYGWREGLLTTVTLQDGTEIRLAPTLNAGTVALLYFFAQVSPDPATWKYAIDPEQGFLAFYHQMFGDPWARAYMVEPLYPPNLKQPRLILPFEKGVEWYFTGGPHGAWEHDGARAALDFAPGGGTGKDCSVSRYWAVAVASGVVTRSERGVVILDLDGDGREQTGWVILYLHIAEEGRAPVGAHLRVGDRVGHPSCEGGHATGTHLHIARKYNGEWMAADGPVPFVMDGWLPHAGAKPYKGWLTKGDRTIVACPCGSLKQLIVRDEQDDEN